MNLHIIPDSKFSKKFIDNLRVLNLLDQNKFVVGTPKKSLQFIHEPIPFAKFNSRKFDEYVGSTDRYDRVFIHQLSPLLYKWISLRNFHELNWLIWGADLYNLPKIEKELFLPQTQVFVKRPWLTHQSLFRLKVYLTTSRYESAAYAKINRVFTWMKSEFDFATKHLPTLTAQHEFFFYENELSYDQIQREYVKPYQSNETLRLILGNSGTPTNNHLDALTLLSKTNRKADVLIPVSYGDKAYIRWLKSKVSFYKNGKVEFLDSFMGFEDYVHFLQSTDGLIMNTLRPQGYGNIFLMMALKKPVFLNPQNGSTNDLNEIGFAWNKLEELSSFDFGASHPQNNSVFNFFDNTKLLNMYENLFR